MTFSSFFHNYSLPKTLPSIDEADRQAVMSILAASQEAKASCIQEFEEGIVHYCDAPFAILFPSVKSALYAAAAALDISSSDRIILPANLPMTQVTPFLHMGARPTLVDIDPDTALMDLEALKDVLNTPSSRGKILVFPSHFAGIPLDLVHLESQIRNPNTLIFEDASHALGSLSLQGQRIGSCAMSDLAIISLESGCTLSTEQGALLLTTQEPIYQRLIAYRKTSLPTSMQAALGLSQLRKLDIFAQQRAKLAALYQEHLSTCPHIHPIASPDPKSWAPGFLQIRCDFKKLGTTRESLIERLKEQGIQASRPPIMACEKLVPTYPETLHACLQAEQAIELPFYDSMNNEDVITICKALQDALS